MPRGWLTTASAVALDAFSKAAERLTRSAITVDGPIVGEAGPDVGGVPHNLLVLLHDPLVVSSCLGCVIEGSTSGGVLGATSAGKGNGRVVEAHFGCGECWRAGNKVVAI